MKIIIDKFAEGCSENTDGKEMISVALNNYGSVCRSCHILHKYKH